MSDYAWAIKSKDKSFDLDTYDYWNNEDGWTEYLSCASLYSDEEKEALLIWNSPIRPSIWVKVKEVTSEQNHEAIQDSKS